LTDSTVAALSDALVQETLLGEAVGHALVGVTVWDEARHYIAVNDTACELMQCTREKFLSLQVGDFIVREGEEVVAHALRAPSRGHTAVRRGDGTVIEIEWIVFPTRAAGLPQFVSLFWPAETL
jgi:PAS domain S-box-containing protein